MDLKKIIKNVTEDTDGKLIYQEQILKVLIELGYPKNEADRIRRAFGKKSKDVIDTIVSDMLKKCNGDMDSINEIIQSNDKAYAKYYLDLYFKSTKAYIDSVISDTGFIKYPIQLMMVNQVLVNENELEDKERLSLDDEISYCNSSLEYHKNNFINVNKEFVEFLESVVNGINLSEENPRFINL